MRPEHYPAQEPLSPAGAAYQARILTLGQGVEGEDVAYGSDPYQSLTVFCPPKPRGDTLVFFHGGGWTNGYKEWMHFMAPAFMAQGVVFVSAGYRLAPLHVFPVGLDDCACAVRWVARNVHRYGADPAQVFVGGHSAGGHYAALLGVTADWREGAENSIAPLRGCLPVSGVYRFGADSGMAVRPRFLGPAEDGRAEIAASPLMQLQLQSNGQAGAFPSFFLTYGDRDFPHLIAQAQAFECALRDAHVSVHSEILEDCDHFEASVACGDASRSWVERAARWMADSQVQPHHKFLTGDRA